MISLSLIWDFIKFNIIFYKYIITAKLVSFFLFLFSVRSCLSTASADRVARQRGWRQRLMLPTNAGLSVNYFFLYNYFFVPPKSGGTLMFPTFLFFTAAGCFFDIFSFFINNFGLSANINMFIFCYFWLSIFLITFVQIITIIFNKNNTFF